MNTSIPIKLLKTGSVLDRSVGKDLRESQNWMPIYSIIAKLSLNVISVPTKIQILEICVPLKENTVTLKVLSVKCADNHSHGLNSIGIT